MLQKIIIDNWQTLFPSITKPTTLSIMKIGRDDVNDTIAFFLFTGTSNLPSYSLTIKEILSENQTPIDHKNHLSTNGHLDKFGYYVSHTISCELFDNIIILVESIEKRD